MGWLRRGEQPTQASGNVVVCPTFENSPAEHLASGDLRPARGLVLTGVLHLLEDIAQLDSRNLGNGGLAGMGGEGGLQAPAIFGSRSFRGVPLRFAIGHPVTGHALEGVRGDGLCLYPGGLLSLSQLARILPLGEKLAGLSLGRPRVLERYDGIGAEREQLLFAGDAVFPSP